MAHVRVIVGYTLLDVPSKERLERLVS